MPTPSRSSPDDSTNAERLSLAVAAEILRHWEASVVAERPATAVDNSTAPLPSDTIPPVLTEILGVGESDDGRFGPEKISRAARHGRERARQQLDVRELVREFQLLRQHIFHCLDERATQSADPDLGEVDNMRRRVGLAVDEAMCETLSAFFEEKTGGLRRLSRTDGLTGLYNHRTFYERLDEELKRALRYEAPLSVVLIDLDDFKAVNDTGGHQFGDTLLIRCAELMRGELRQTDIVCRYGGDEFGVIMPETTGEAARSMMGRLSEAFIKLGRVEGAPAAFGMSFGLSAHPEDDGRLTRLVKIADERLLLNKRVKKNAPDLAAPPKSPAEVRQAVSG